MVCVYATVSVAKGDSYQKLLKNKNIFVNN